MNILILGPQGSGKGTQARLISEKYGFFYFESGSFLRNLAKENDEINDHLNKGELLPDSLMFSLVTGYLEEKGLTDNIIFDGYPRSVAQFNFLSEYLAGKGSKIDLAIFLDISEKESIRRVGARRIDKTSGEIYNLITDVPPANVDIANLIQREDDQEEAIKERLKLYHSVTQPLIAIYEEKGILRKVNGEANIDEICAQINSIIDKKTNE